MKVQLTTPSVLNLRLFTIIYTTFLAFVSVHSQCNVNPTGVDDVDGIQTVDIMSLIDGSTLGQPLPYLFLVLVDDYIGAVVESYEAPIEFRQTLYHGMNGYNVVAMYHPTALDIWGQGDDHRICVEDFDSEEQKLAHEQIASAYTFAYGALKFNPQVTDAMVNIMDNVLQLPMNKILEGNPPISTPWGLAKHYVDQMAEYAASDGWNADGSLANVFNKLPFNDFSYGDYKGYSPAYNYDTAYVENITKTCKEQAEQANKLSRSSKMSGIQGLKESTKMAKWPWFPLLESDGHGHFTRQEFVTPHIGFTSRLYGINVTEYEGFYADDPRYDYCFETEKVIEETRIMATDEEQKARIEMFNSKFTSLLPMQVNWSIMKGFDLFQFWFYDVALVAAMYDSTVLVWREKVLHDMVRPTTVVHTLKGDDMIDSYAGPFNGAQNIKATDWTPYVRTMPHAEYPSGSACVCTAYAETMQVLTGKDDTDIPVTMLIPAGSSKKEPGVVPATDLTLTYNKWSTIQEECGLSRLHGGMHFSKAVPDGQELCSGVAALIIDRAEMLKNGNSAGAFADLNDVSIVVKSVNTTASPVEPGTCPSGYSGLIATSDCKGYYLCLNGALASENPTYCPDGLLYNNDLQVCDLETNVDCESTPATPMPTIAPTVAPTESDACPFGYSGLIATSDCSGFYHCSDGSLIVGSPTNCPGGTLFNNIIQACDFESNVDCSSNLLTPMPTITSTVAPTFPPVSPTTAPSERPVQPDTCPSGYSGLVATDDCKGYYHCLNGSLIVVNPTYCQTGLLFRNDLQVCDWDYNVDCDEMSM